MAKRLACVAAETLEWRTFIPEPVGSRQVRIRTQFAAAKHGTKMALYRGYAMARGVFDPEHQLFRPSPPDAICYLVGVGNMVVGIVEEVGPEGPPSPPATACASTAALPTRWWPPPSAAGRCPPAWTGAQP